MSYHIQTPSRDLNNMHRKRKRVSHESEELAWTAARCSRLLRSITHRLGALRKMADSSHGVQTVKPVRTVEKRVASHWSTQDPVWMGDARRKTKAKTFAGKNKVSKQQSESDARKGSSTTFPSPFVRRVAFGGAASPMMPFVRPAIPPPRLTRQLPIKAGSPRMEAENGLLSAFASILGTTDARLPRRSHGARSLTSTCLRNVPQYIAINEEGEQDSNFSSETLSYLEDFGTKENGGWSGLREVVRSQAIFAVCAAIEDGVLSEKTIRELVEQCGKQEAIPEGQQILTVWIDAGESVTPKQIETLITFGREQRCEASNIRLMRAAVELDCTKLADFLKPPRFWNNLLRFLASTSHHEAAEFLSIISRGCIEQGNSHPRDLTIGLKETVVKLTAMAASLTLLDNGQTSHGSMSQIVYRLTADEVFSGHSHTSGELHKLLISCSLFLLGVSADSYGSFNASDLSNILSSTSRVRSQRSDFAAEIISTLIVLERHVHSDLTSILLERMVERASVAPLYKQIAMAAVTAKQQDSESAEDEALFADYINRISFPPVESTIKTPRTPFRKNQIAQYRWEEGISEWVTKTPFAAAAVAPPTPSSIILDNPGALDKENWVLPLQMECCKSAKKSTRLPQNSPDVLAISPGPRAVAQSPLRQRHAKRARLSHAQSVLFTKEVRRRTSRLSNRSRAAEDSADELGF